MPPMMLTPPNAVFRLLGFAWVVLAHNFVPPFLFPAFPAGGNKKRLHLPMQSQTARKPSIAPLPPWQECRQYSHRPQRRPMSGPSFRRLGLSTGVFKYLLAPPTLPRRASILFCCRLHHIIPKGFCKAQTANFFSPYFAGEASCMICSNEATHSLFQFFKCFPPN